MSDAACSTSTEENLELDFISENSKLINLNLRSTLQELKLQVESTEKTQLLLDEERKSLSNMLIEEEIKQDRYKKEVADLGIELEKLKMEQISLEEKFTNSKISEYIDEKTRQMFYFIEEHFITNEIPSNSMSMIDLIELLIDRRMNDPSDPYIDIDDTFWPPHVQLLIRFDIVKYSPNNMKKTYKTK